MNNYDIYVANTNINFDDVVSNSASLLPGEEGYPDNSTVIQITEPIISNLKNPTSTAKLQLNGHDRFSTRISKYFNYLQPYQHHTGYPKLGINCYSFALNPEEHNPTGTCNMSRIDSCILRLENNITNAKISIYAINYNVLRIMSGMGGLAYSN